MLKISNWFFYTLLTLFLWGFWGFFPKLTSRYMEPRSALIYEVVGCILVGIAVFFTVGGRLEHDSRGILFAILTGALGLLGSLAFLAALRAGVGKGSIIVLITALYPLIVIFLSVFFLKESFTPRQIAGIVLALIAMLLFAE